MSKEVNYQAMRAELDEIVEQLQEGTLDIDEATKQYERATQLIKQLEDYLKVAENKISKVKIASK